MSWSVIAVAMANRGMGFLASTIITMIRVGEMGHMLPMGDYLNATNKILLGNIPPLLGLQSMASREAE